MVVKAAREVMSVKQERVLKQEKNEHTSNVKQNAAHSKIANHSCAQDHTINFEDGQAFVILKITLHAARELMYIVRTEKMVYLKILIIGKDSLKH